MVAVTYNSVAFQAGPHHRQPRSGPGGFLLLRRSSGGNPIAGTFKAQPPALTITLPPPDGRTFLYSFMTVSGGGSLDDPNGPPVGVSSFDPNGAPPQEVSIGATDINVLIVYVPTGVGGPPGSGSGATIDQFDEITGLPLDDTFVTVEPDPTGALTNSANVDGFVDTTNSGEAITALPTTSPSGAGFVGWATLGPPGHFDTSPILPVGQGQSVQALAFYQDPPINLTGTVREDSIEGIDVLPGALIVAAPGGRTRTGDDGTYAFRNLDPGPVKLTASSISAAAPETDTVTVVAGQTITHDFVLVRKGTTS